MRIKNVPVYNLFFEGDRIVARWLQATDYGKLYDWWDNDPVVPDAFDTSWSFADPLDLAQGLTYVRVHPVDYVRRRALTTGVRSLELARKITLVITRLSAVDDPIGVLVFYDIDWEQKSFSIRNYLERSSRGNHFGREMYILAFEFAFEELGFESVFAGVKKPNMKNQKTSISCGMEIVDVREKHLPVAGVLRDSVDFLMTRRKWQRAKAYMSEHHVSRVYYTRLANENGLIGLRQERNEVSCLQVAAILGDLPKGL